MTKQEVSDRNRANYLRNREARLAYQKQYYLENREKCLEESRRANSDRHDELLANEKAYYAKNRERYLEYFRRYDADHKKQRKLRDERYKETIKANPSLKRPIVRKRPGGDYHARKRAATIGVIDYEYIKVRDRMVCCICRRKVFIQDLSFDHSVPISLDGAHVQINLRVAHFSCNSRRGAARLPVQMVLFDV